ncbi:DUF3768 domain-containing protein [Paracoccus litorisediminis]|uniref:DUF3768 domain-containing protein n=1 Tax=Paracoccus litorisediminis TaxID=2006130 RepID=A0A844HMP8_9RHOB|nr:DUF3768 domain-containing protein [Paracoccus litorisediminis]MTH61146.1 DUF3768 domain-containing protein [Paracoccus litorisediminis]
MTDRPDLIENLSPEQRETAARIAELNDTFRLSLIGKAEKPPHCDARIMGDLSGEMLSLDPNERMQRQIDLMGRIATFGPFVEGNDPNGERDFGSFVMEGADDRIMWKIDYYDLEQEMHSPDPTDPAVTHRVLTIFYSRDY